MEAPWDLVNRFHFQPYPVEMFLLPSDDDSCSRVLKRRKVVAKPGESMKWEKAFEEHRAKHGHEP